jgi:hypothetical protein
LTGEWQWGSAFQREIRAAVFAKMAREDTQAIFRMSKIGLRTETVDKYVDKSEVH